MSHLDKLLEAIEKLENKFIQQLLEAVSIPSVSGIASYRQNVFKMADFLFEKMQTLGIDVEKRFMGTQILDGQEIDLPPVILGKYGDDKNKKSVLIYGHYDVQPALLSDGWKTDPWKLTYDENSGCMYGRGITDDKGPVLGWLNVFEAFQVANLDLPVNLIFCYEGMEENGSIGLDTLIKQEAFKYFANVDCICISDNYWLGTKKPCLTYGLRGVICFKVSISGPAEDLHSGLYGGIVHEPMTDLIHLFSSLVRYDGTMRIPGIMDDVAPLTAEEEAFYDNISISMDEIHQSLGSKTTVYNCEKDILMHRWRYPSLSFHGIEGAFSEPGVKTVIPAKVIGKFSIRIVPNMDPNCVSALVKKYLETVFLSLNTKNTLIVEPLHGNKAWLSSTTHWNYMAAVRATEKIYNMTPDFIREGGSIPVALIFEECLKKNVLLLPMGRGDDGAHSVNEKLDKSNYINGTKLFGAYLYEIAAL